jgi:hypothetical protein
MINHFMVEQYTTGFTPAIAYRAYLQYDQNSIHRELNPSEREYTCSERE